MLRISLMSPFTLILPVILVAGFTLLFTSPVHAENAEKAEAAPDAPAVQQAGTEVPGEAAETPAPAEEVEASPKSTLTGRIEARREARRAKQEAEASDRNYLVKGTRLSHSGYGGPQMKFSKVAGQDALLVGGRGAWLIGDHFGLGGAGYGLVNQVETEELGNIMLGYGGPFVETILFPDSLVHLSAGLMLGFGGAAYGAEGAERQSQSLVILEPEIHAQLNISRFLQLATGFSYRWAASGKTEELNVSNGAISVLLKFGWFE